MRLAVITDEISEDLGEALEVMQAHEVKGAELRGLWGQNIANIDQGTCQRAAQLLKAYGASVCSIASPVYKTHLYADADNEAMGNMHLAATVPLEGQIVLLKSCLEKANYFECPLLRIFAFWRQVAWSQTVEEQIIDALERLLPYAERAGVVLGLENEHACLCGTAEETKRVTDRLSSPYLKVIWDPGNAFVLGEDALTGYALIRDRMAHLHIKDGKRVNNDVQWVIVGQGDIDYAGQFAALKHDGYPGYISLETHAKVEGLSQAEVSARCLQAMRQLMQN
ncbi:MAG: sugar phosphate isomerase/epimerase [Fimbriimonadia bacterium]|nr:sugar phosphate isomerase/epimerase [Fimbriimonadia bacterium]